jgi:hypothetical protein
MGIKKRHIESGKKTLRNELERKRRGINIYFDKKKFILFLGQLKPKNSLKSNG